MPNSVAAVLAGLLLVIHGTAILFALRAIRTARTPQGAVGWAIVLIVLPYVAVPVFVIFGSFHYPGVIRARIRTERMARRLAEAAATAGRFVDPATLGMAEGFEAIAGRPVVGGNAATLLVEGEAVFETLFTSIREARHFVLIQTYILRDDGLGHALQELLIAKAAEGVRVCVLYDPFGSHGLHHAYLQRMREGGVEITNFHARHPSLMVAPMRINFRNHRKIAVIDGRVAFTGGYNFGDEYVGRDPRLGPWRDTMVRLEGEVVAQLLAVFAEDWLWATGEVLEQEAAAAGRPATTGDLPAVIVSSGPADPHETGTLHFEHAITAARRRLWIATPYFTPDPGLMNALRLAVLRGVDVRVIMAGRRDHWLVWLAGFAFLDEMRDSGVRFHRYDRGFLHQKVLLIDDDVAVIGSHNLDGRSCRLNFEASAVIFDTDFARAVATMLEADFATCPAWERPLDDEPAWLRWSAPVARLFAPVL